MNISSEQFSKASTQFDGDIKDRVFSNKVSTDRGFVNSKRAVFDRTLIVRENIEVCVITPRACARGKVVGFVRTKIARSRDEGTTKGS